MLMCTTFLWRDLTPLFTLSCKRLRLLITVQNLSPDMIRYLQKKHRLLKRCFYKLNLNLNQKPQLILLSIDQPCIRNKVGPGGGYRI